MAVQLINKDGSRSEVNIGLELYREAADNKLTLRQLVNQKFPTSAEAPEPFKQFCASAGIRFEKNNETGRPASTLREILDPIGFDAATNRVGGTYTSSPMIPDSRILFPAAIQEAVENKLVGNYGALSSAFEDLIGMSDTVASRRVEQPVLDYSGKQGPEDSKYQRIAQNSRPPIMLSLKASDISRTIPSLSIACEISDEAMATPIDFLSLGLSRFAMMADYNEWITSLGLMLNGDPDATVTPMSAATSALATITAQSLDAAVTTAGTISQKAYVSFLHRNSLTMQKSHLIMDLNTAMAVDARAGRPTNITNNGNPGDRIDVPMVMSFPTFDGNVVKALVLPVGVAIPANTIWAIDKRFAIYRTISSVASYSAVENVVMKKSTEFRWDRGMLLGRLYDSAHEVMTLTV